MNDDAIEAVPESLAHLQPAEENSPDWLARFRQAVLSSVQEGLYASLYHLWRIEAIESCVLAIAQQHAPGLGMPAASAAGGGNTRALDCEYQAFVFATCAWAAVGRCGSSASASTRGLTATSRQRSTAGFMNVLDLIAPPAHF